MTTPRTLLRAALSSCPIDGAVTTDGRTLTEHETVRAAAVHVIAHLGTRILCVGSAVNGGGGLTCEEERVVLEEARAAARL